MWLVMLKLILIGTMLVTTVRENSMIANTSAGFKLRAVRKVDRGR